MRKAQRKMTGREFVHFASVHFALCISRFRSAVVPRDRRCSPCRCRISRAPTRTCRRRRGDLYAIVDSARRRSQGVRTDLGAAYGKLGMLLQAAEYYDAAEPCYRNAQTLCADRSAMAILSRATCTRARAKRKKRRRVSSECSSCSPIDVAALIWLGRLYLDEGRTDEAEPLFAKALALAPRTVAALAGLGRAGAGEARLRPGGASTWRRRLRSIPRPTACTPRSRSPTAAWGSWTRPNRTCVSGAIATSSCPIR